MGEASVAEETEPDLDSSHFKLRLPERLVLEVILDPFEPKCNKVLSSNVDLTIKEIRTICHGSYRLNFRNCLYVMNPDESGLNRDGEPVKRFTYNKHYKGGPPKFD